MFFCTVCRWWNQILPPLSLRSIKTILANPTQIQTTSSVNACCELLTLMFKLSRRYGCNQSISLLSSFNFFNLFNSLNCASIVFIPCHMHYCWFSEAHLPECVGMFTRIHIVIVTESIRSGDMQACRWEFVLTQLSAQPLPHHPLRARHKLLPLLW